VDLEEVRDRLEIEALANRDSGRPFAAEYIEKEKIEKEKPDRAVEHLPDRVERTT
jgi:hypothetical protein